MKGYYPFAPMDCPACKAKRVASDLVYFEHIIERSNNNVVGVFTFICGNCGIPISGKMQTNNKKIKEILVDFEDYIQSAAKNWGHMHGSPSLSAGIDLFAVWPEPQRPKVMEFLPDEVNAAMTDAETAKSVGTPNRMVRAAYRTVIDVATENVFQINIQAFPNNTKPQQNLSNRINMLAAQHFLTPTLKEWAHGIRFITNEDVHTSNPVTNEEVDEIAEFARMLLQYLYELPGRVARAKAEAEVKRDPAAET